MNNTPSTFNPTSLAVYTRHSRGLWHPATGNNSSLFVITMSTRNNAGTTNNADTTTNTAALAHCPSLADVQEHLHALAQRYGATRLTDGAVGSRYEITGARATRMLWIQEVGHARALKMVDLDDVDGGMGEDVEKCLS